MMQKLMIFVVAFALVLACTWLSPTSFAQEADDDGIDALLAQGAEAEAGAGQGILDPLQPMFYSYGREIAIGQYSIVNLWMSGRRQAESAAVTTDQRFWRTFMHGVTDAGAMPKLWSSCFGTGQNLEEMLDLQAVIQNDLKSSNLPALRLSAKQSLLLGKPVLSAADLNSLRGGYVRFFVWIKAQDTGQNADLWGGSPALVWYLQDSNGVQHNLEQTVFKTRGTFPWFCYHVDLAIPQNLALLQAADDGEEAATPAINDAVEVTDVDDTAEEATEGDNVAESLGDFATLLQNHLPATAEEIGQEEIFPKGAGLYLRLANPASGTAWFSTLSWKKIPSSESLFSPSVKLTRVDPLSGSLAPNPDYDSLAMHFYYGLSPQKNWNFVQGTRVLSDMTRLANLRAYLQSASHDWAEMIHGVSRLVSLYNNGMLMQLAPAFEANWDQELISGLRGLQDGRTGMWRVNGEPNLLATWQIARGCFQPTRQQRADRAAPQPTPWLAISDQTLPNAEALVRTLLQTQRQAPRSTFKAGWNLYLFTRDDLRTPAQQLPCDLMATAAAAQLLSQAMPLVNENLQVQSQEAIYQAWLYVMRYLVFRDLGIWRMRHGDQEATSPAGFFAFLDATPWLEMRQAPGEPEPAVEAIMGGNNRMTVKWLNPAEDQVSLRIYAAPEELPTSKINESHLVAIIQQNGEKLDTMDPLLAMQFIAAAAMRKWLVGTEHDGAEYLTEKLAAIPEKLTQVKQTKNVAVTIRPDQEKTLKTYAAAVNAYGEMSAWKTLPVTVHP